MPARVGRTAAGSPPTAARPDAGAAAGGGGHPRHALHPVYGGTQDPVLGDVDGELVVADLQRPRLAAVAVHLVDLTQPAPQHRGRVVDDAVALQQPLPQGAFGLAPQRLGQHRHQVRRLGHGQVLVAPARAGGGVADQEQQPLDGHLRRYPYLQVAHAGGADEPVGAHPPAPGRLPRLHGNDAGAGQRLRLSAGQRDLDARPSLTQRDRQRGRFMVI